MTDLNLNVKHAHLVHHGLSLDSPEKILQHLETLAKQTDLSSKLIATEEHLSRSISVIRAAGLPTPHVLIVEKQLVAEQKANMEKHQAFFAANMERFIELIHLAAGHRVPTTDPQSSSKTPAVSGTASPPSKETPPSKKTHRMIAKSTVKPGTVLVDSATSKLSPRGVIRKGVINAVATLGGVATKTDVLEAMASAMSDQFTPDDKKQYRAGRNETAWQATASWVASELKREGIFRTDVKAGIWSLA